MMLSVKQSYHSKFQTDLLTLTRVMSKLVANFQCRHLQCRHQKCKNRLFNMHFPMQKKIFVFYKFFNFLLFLGVKYTRKKCLKIKKLNFSIVTKSQFELVNNLQSAHI